MHHTAKWECDPDTFDSRRGLSPLSRSFFLISFPLLLQLSRHTHTSRRNPALEEGGGSQRVFLYGPPISQFFCEGCGSSHIDFAYALSGCSSPKYDILPWERYSSRPACLPLLDGCSSSSPFPFKPPLTAQPLCLRLTARGQELHASRRAFCTCHH
ncbi:hypothetical protein ARMSODRAFT_299870 [Armillaria solidipes]|uniref:Uncharacterized protein n=1 Tax=Armillaria solidipes TaxID=1076256 RepID=A0A2H3BT25_9AGAR|nr:hypothetical protein ARMSODRAFT_299870 [Armillaria solidipes]